jgi:hypothetical protein
VRVTLPLTFSAKGTVSDIFNSGAAVDWRVDGGQIVLSLAMAPLSTRAIRIESESCSGGEMQKGNVVVNPRQPFALTSMTF